MFGLYILLGKRLTDWESIEDEEELVVVEEEQHEDDVDEPCGHIFMLGLCVAIYASEAVKRK